MATRHVDNPSAGFYTSARTGMLPGGRVLEAVGSYDGSRARGLRVLLLTPIQIQNPLQKKIIAG